MLPEERRNLTILKRFFDNDLFSQNQFKNTEFFKK